MTVNVELLERVMRHIEDHPAQHDQGIWLDECGTAGCFAGWACLLSGWRPSVVFAPGCGLVISPDTLVERGAYDAALDLLGIDTPDALTLFDAVNTAPMLSLMVKDLVNGEPLRDADEYRDEAEGGEL